MLDYFGITRLEQQRLQTWMLRELGAKHFSHDVVFHRFPIGTQWTLATPPHPRSNHRRFRLTNSIFVVSASELLGLEIMLGSRPNPTVHFDRMWREVRELTVRLV